MVDLTTIVTRSCRLLGRMCVVCLKSLKVLDRNPEQLNVVPEASNTKIAVDAKQGSDLSGYVIVIYGKTFYKLNLMLATNRATTALQGKHSVVLFKIDAVFPLEVNLFHVVNMKLAPSLSVCGRTLTHANLAVT